jgi:hypothetical protein
MGFDPAGPCFAPAGEEHVPVAAGSYLIGGVVVLEGTLRVERA